MTAREVCARSSQPLQMVFREFEVGVVVDHTKRIAGRILQKRSNVLQQFERDIVGLHVAADRPDLRHTESETLAIRSKSINFSLI